MLKFCHNEYFVQHSILESLKEHWDYTTGTSVDIEDLKITAVKLRNRLMDKGYSKSQIHKNISKLSQLKYISTHMPKGDTNYVRYRLETKGEQAYLESTLKDKGDDKRERCLGTWQKIGVFITGVIVASVSIYTCK